VSAENQGHGFFRLRVRSLGISQSHVIAEGSWELETFLLNPARWQVLYPEAGWFAVPPVFIFIRPKLRCGSHKCSWRVD
jgi:hypothetical protein